MTARPLNRARAFKSSGPRTCWDFIDVVGSEPIQRFGSSVLSLSGIDFQDVGLHELKGIPGEWSLFSAG
jgi:hypothetical protein